MARKSPGKKHRPASYGLKQTHITPPILEEMLYGAPLPDLARQERIALEQAGAAKCNETKESNHAKRDV